MYTSHFIILQINDIDTIPYPILTMVSSSSQSVNRICNRMRHNIYTYLNNQIKKCKQDGSDCLINDTQTERHLIYHVIQFVQFPTECQDQIEKNCLLLLEALDVCACYKIPERGLVRTILTALYSITYRIDREAFYWDTEDDLEVDQDIKQSKQNYLLNHAAGWAIDVNQKPWDQNTGATYYLELPFACPSGIQGQTQMIADALYRKNDPELVLTLLRHGVQASCTYLWPLMMAINLKLNLDPAIPEAQVCQFKEMAYIRYFNRAKSNFSLQLVSGQNVVQTMPLSNDNRLLVAPKIKNIISKDRLNSPTTLQHQCRLHIRQSLLAADNMPRGIRELPFPSILLKYVDLQHD